MNGSERAAIRRLRAGVVPAWELERLSVGYDRITATVRRALRALQEHSQPDPLFVRGEWGTGKTHCLAYVRAAANSEGIPNAKVDLNGRSGALNYPQRFYGELAESVKLQAYSGLRSLISGLLQNKSKREHLKAFAKGGFAGTLGAPLAALAARHEDARSPDFQEDPAWFAILGGDLTWADYAYKRNDALARIAALGRFFTSVGLGGLTVVFDEAETIDQLWDIRSRKTAYNVLGALCRCPGLWPVFSITQRFERVVAADIWNGILKGTGLGEPGIWFLSAWSRRELPKVSPPSIDPTNAFELVQRIATLYSVAYPATRAEKALLVRCVAEWQSNPSQNPRRLIRVLVHRLDAARSF